MDEYELTKFYGKTDLDYDQRLLCVEMEIQDKDCLWGGQCASWSECRCRRRKVKEMADIKPIYSDLSTSWVETPSTDVNIPYYLPDLLSGASLEEDHKDLAYHPHTDHNYHAILSPSPPPTPPPIKREPSPIRVSSTTFVRSSPMYETPTDSCMSDSESDSEIDVVSLSDHQPAAKRRKISSKKMISRAPSPPAVATSRRKSGKPLTFVKQALARKASNNNNNNKTNNNKKKTTNSESLKLTIARINSQAANAPKNWTKNGGKYRVKGSRSAFAPGISEEERNKRLAHNKMERQRRKMSLDFCDALRDLIPCFNSQRTRPKQSKVLVLKEAVNYIKKLHEEEHDLIQKKEYFQRQQKELMATLSNMKNGNCKMVRRSQTNNLKKTTVLRQSKRK